VPWFLDNAKQKRANVPVVGASPAKQDLILEIQRLHQRREPLNLLAVRRSHPDLVKRVYAVKPFWGWKWALEEAGLDYSRINTEVRDFVECRICGREAALLTAHLKSAHQITAKEYRDEFPGAEIYCETLRAARSEIRRKHSVMPHWEALWTSEYVLDRTAELHRQGYPVHASWVLCHEKQLANFGYRLFGTWDEVLRRIGLDPKVIRHQAEGRSLSNEEVIAQLQERKRAGRRLNESTLAQENLRLLNAARRRFGSYRAALGAAGIQPEGILRSAGKISAEETEACLAEIRRIASAPVHELKTALADFRARYGEVVQRKFGSLRAACREAGNVPYERFSSRLYADREAVLDALRDRLANGLSIKGGAMFREDRTLHESVIREFRSCEQATQALGLPDTNGQHIRTFDTAQSVIAELRRRGRCWLSLDEPSVSGQRLASGTNLRLFRHACHHFGTWDAALRSAGIRQGRAILRPERGIKCYPDEAAVIGAIRRLGRYFRRWKIWSPDHALCTRAFALFGSWLAAVRATGVTCEMAEDFLFPYDRAFSSASGLLGSIRCWIQQGGTVAKSAITASDSEGRLLVRAATLCFGSWEEGVRAAGFHESGASKYSSPKSVVAEIKRRAVAGRPIQRWELEKGTDRDAALTSAGVRHFGSWPEALKAAGFDARTLLREKKRQMRTYPDKESVVRAISKRHQAGMPVTAAQLTRGDHPDLKLLHSGTEYFGKWDRALETAGIDPSQLRQQIILNQRHYPDRGAVLSGIRRRIAQGLPMNPTSLQRGADVDLALFTHARRFFGSWKAAIAAIECVAAD
jgi:hypothetical protein